MDTRTAPRILRRALATLIAAAALVTTMVAIAPASAQAATSIDRYEVTEVRMINHFRASHGLPPMRIDGTLSATAAWHARNLGTHHMFGHVDYLGRDPFQRLRAFGYPSSDTWRGENVAAGNSGPAPTYSQWLNSPPHKANWMNRRYRAIGIARVRVAGSPYGYYWVTTFGSRWTRPAA
jgi:uncharacterized protein YkwD